MRSEALLPWTWNDAQNWWRRRGTGGARRVKGHWCYFALVSTECRRIDPCCSTERDASNCEKLTGDEQVLFASTNFRLCLKRNIVCLFKAMWVSVLLLHDCDIARVLARFWCHPLQRVTWKQSKFVALRSCIFLYRFLYILRNSSKWFHERPQEHNGWVRNQQADGAPVLGFHGCLHCLWRLLCFAFLCNVLSVCRGRISVECLLGSLCSNLLQTNLNNFTMLSKQIKPDQNMHILTVWPSSAEWVSNTHHVFPRHSQKESRCWSMTRFKISMMSTRYEHFNSIDMSIMSIALLIYWYLLRLQPWAFWFMFLDVPRCS